MTEIEGMKSRIQALEGTVSALVGVVNMLIEDVFEPEFVSKIDNLVDYGKEAGE